MIQSVMLVLLGFFAAGLLVLLVAPAYWRRAVRITTEHMKRTMPMTTAEIRADKDRIRAESAIRIHRLQKKAEQLKLNEARQLIELNRRDARINEFDQDVKKLKSDLTENQNARRVMEQTINYRLPQIEARLLESKRLLSARDRDMVNFVKSARKQDEVLAEARAFHEQQRREIDRLRNALTLQQTRDRGRVRDPVFGSELALKSEIEALRSRNRDQTSVIERLQLEVVRLNSSGSRAKPANGKSTEKEGDLNAAALAERNRILSEEVEALKLKLSGSEKGALMGAGGSGDRDQPEAKVDPQLLQSEIKKLRAKTEAQSEEIAGLTSELKAVYDSSEEAGRPLPRITKRVLDSKISALEKRTERQAETVARLRAELASANERSARQAAHYMKEMRQLGVGPLSQPYEVKSKEDVYSVGAPKTVRPGSKDNENGNGTSNAPPRGGRRPARVKVFDQPDNAGSGQGDKQGATPKDPAKDRTGTSSGSGDKDMAQSPVAAKGRDAGRKRLIDRISGSKKT